MAVLLATGLGCGKSGATDPAGSGGSSGSGGTVVTGGVAGSQGAGGASSSAGAIGSGGRMGSGGVTGGGGTSSVRDGGLRDGRDARAEVGGAVDAVADAASTQPDLAGVASDAGCVPDYACKPVSPDTGDPYADCVARVNQFRACVCLPPLARWTAGEACADQDAKYDSEQNTAHAGAQADICDWGNAQDECPGWNRATPASVVDRCLQMMFDEGPPPTSTCTGQCYTDHGHYLNMTGTGYKYGVACGFYTTSSGALWAVQNFK